MVQSLPRSDSFRILFNSPELSEVQRAGFHSFLKNGIAEELSKISCIPIKNAHFTVEILVDASHFRLVAPENSYRDCILKMKSYTCKLYVQIRILFKDKISGEFLYQTQPEWVLLADLPMMTKRGHFVINGSPRIVVHQVARAPGVYFKKVLKVKNDITNKARFYGDIIPRKGVWVRLQINKKGEIDLKLKKSKKVRAEMVQKCLELLEKEDTFAPFQKFVAGSRSTLNKALLCNTYNNACKQPESKFNFEIKQNRYKEKPFSGVYKARISNNFAQVCTRAKQKRSRPRGVTKAEMELKLWLALLLGANKSRTKTSFWLSPFVTSGAKNNVLIHTQNTVKEQALIRNMFYFKNIKVAIANKAVVKAPLLIPLGASVAPVPNRLNIDNNTNVPIPCCTFFSGNFNGSGNLKASRLDLGKSLMQLDINSCADNKIVRSFVIGHDSKKLFSAFTRAENEAFANVYSNFNKNEIKDIEKRISVSKAKSVKTKCSLSSTEPPVTQAQLGYNNKKQMTKRSNLSERYLYQLFKKSDLYDLGSVGRDKINAKFGISVKETQLTALDIKKTINWLSKLRAGKEEIDDIDHSQNRRVRTSSELIQTQFEIGITRLKNGVLKRVLSPSAVINVKGEQIKATFYSQIVNKLEENGYEEFIKPRLTHYVHNQTGANKSLNKSEAFVSPFVTGVNQNEVLVSPGENKIGAEQKGKQKLRFCSSFYYGGAFNKAKSLYHSFFEYNNIVARSSVTCHLAIVFTQSHLGLQIVKPITKVQIKSKRKQFDFGFTKLHFKGGTSCFVKQDVMSVKLKSNGVKKQNFLLTVDERNQSKALVTFRTKAKLHLPVRFGSADNKSYAFVRPGFVTPGTSVKKQYQKLALVWPKHSSRLSLCSVNINCIQTDALHRQSINNSTTRSEQEQSRPSRTKATLLLPAVGSAFEQGLLAKHNTVSLYSQGIASFGQAGKKTGKWSKAPFTGRKQDSLTLTQKVLPPSNNVISDFSASEWFSTKPINGALREFFSSSPLSQYMDQTNPLAEVTHKRRISSLGVGGVSRESAGMTIRGIHPTHYGRICPIETPEGKNAGLVNSLAFYARVNPQGFIETPYYQIVKGQVQHELGFSFYSAGQESRNGLSIAPNDIKQSKSKLLASNISAVESIPVRIADNLLDLFKKKRPSQVDCIGISPVQILSVATSLIPFLEHNDANRALMGSNMQRQAVSLMSSERPLVGTGLEAKVLAESGHLVQSKVSGFISNVSAHQVIVEQLISHLSRNKTQCYQGFAIKGRAHCENQGLTQNRDLYSNPLFWTSCCTNLTGGANNKSIGLVVPGKPQLRSRTKASGQQLQTNLALLRLGPSEIPKQGFTSFNWSIKKNNYERAKLKQNLTKLNNTISKRVVVLPQLQEAQIGQRLCHTGGYKSSNTSEACVLKGLNGASLWLALRFSPFVQNKTGSFMTRTEQSFVMRSSCKNLLNSQNFVYPFKKKEVALSSVIHCITTFSRSNQETCLTQKPLVKEGDWVQRGDMLSDCSAGQKGELSVGKNMFIAYIPWQGYNFEDAIVISDRLVKEQLYTSLHIERYTVIVNDFKDKVIDTNEWFTGKLPGVESKKRAHLQKSGLPKIGAILREGDILVGKIKYSKKKPTTPHEKLVCDILGEHNFSVQNTSLYVPKGVHEARVLTYKIKKRFDKALKTGIATPGKSEFGHNKASIANGRANLRPAGAPKIVHLFLGEKRNIQVGDKMSGRHGNKGIVSTILPKQDMPYLADGSPIDILLNPLGVPSRMNVGQVFECLLGLASTYLHQHFKVTAFDELYGVEASQSLVFLKLYQARLQSGQNWLFQVNFPGKTRLTDGRSGECLDQWITVGKAYILKLIHMVNEKIHARAIGPYALVTQQPLKGRAHKGGQRLGEMEVWAIEGFGAAYILQELLTKKSDDSIGRKEVLKAMLPKSASLLDFLDPFGQSTDVSTLSKQENILHSEGFALPNPSSALVRHQSLTVLGQPDIFKVLICELQALCLDVGVYSIKTESFQRQFVGIFE